MIAGLFRLKLSDHKGRTDGNRWKECVLMDPPCLRPAVNLWEFILPLGTQQVCPSFILNVPHEREAIQLGVCGNSLSQQLRTKGGRSRWFPRKHVLGWQILNNCTSVRMSMVFKIFLVAWDSKWFPSWLRNCNRLVPKKVTSTVGPLCSKDAGSPPACTLLRIHSNQHKNTQQGHNDSVGHESSVF